MQDAESAAGLCFLFVLRFSVWILRLKNSEALKRVLHFRNLYCSWLLSVKTHLPFFCRGLCHYTHNRLTLEHCISSEPYQNLDILRTQNHFIVDKCYVRKRQKSEMEVLASDLMISMVKQAKEMIF